MQLASDHPLVEFFAGTVVDSMKDKPCACGKRKCADKLIMLSREGFIDKDISVIRVRSLLRCEVCKVAHPADKVIAVEPELISGLEKL